MELQTKRLLLRPWVRSDARALYAYASDPRIGPIAGFPPHTDVQNSREIIRTVLSQPETYALCLRESGEVVGSAGIISSNGHNPAMTADQREIGYWIGVPFWGQGLVPEAVEALLERCFRELNCRGVWCGYYDGNDKSRRVQEKCGFVYAETIENVPVPLLGEKRTEHFTYLSREHWERRTPEEKNHG